MREYRFVDFSLQPEQRRLFGPDGQAVELSPRLFDALLFFVLNAGALLDKDRLLAELWPGLVVEENSLSQTISALRRALGDDAQRSRFIQTVPRRGFRFIAPVAIVEAAPATATPPPRTLLLPQAPLSPQAAAPTDTAPPLHAAPSTEATPTPPSTTAAPSETPPLATTPATPPTPPAPSAPSPEILPPPTTSAAPRPPPTSPSTTPPVASALALAAPASAAPASAAPASAAPASAAPASPAPASPAPASPASASPAPASPASGSPSSAPAPHDEPPAGGQAGRLASPPAGPAASRRVWVGGLAIGTLAFAAAGVAGWRWRSAPGPSAAAGGVRTLAVLPFKSIVAGAADELLEVGMAESIVSRLSNLPGVAVRSVSSVRRYRGADQDPIGAARELTVTWIVDGSVQRVGARVRVSARLLNTTTGEAAWSGSFDEDYTDVFALQDSISTKVAQVLAPRLERGDRRRLAGAGGTRHVDAYQLYLAARQNAQGINAAGLLKSIDLYRQAIGLDPAYAQAWSGLAESYRRMVFGADGEPRVVLAESTRAGERAVELDAGSADAHAGVGWNRFWRDWDWDGARASFERALALNASESNAHFGYSQLLEAQGRDVDALDHLRQARESDPLSLILLTLESSSLISAGRVAEARQRLQRVFDIAPDFWVAHMVQSRFLAIDGKPDDALESMARADRLADGSSQAAAALGYALARKGQPERARGVLQRLLDQAKTRYVPPTSIGLVHAGLGDKAAAMAALEAGYAVRDVRMTLVWFDRRWSVVKDDPRFAVLRRQMNLS